MLIRAILPPWASEKYLNRPRVFEGDVSQDKIRELNSLYYNIYFLPNYPSHYDSSKNVDGSDIDIFKYVFIDMDMKSNVYKSKEEFITLLKAWSLQPSLIVDSGNGIHAYYEVVDLTGESYLRLQRRLCRKFNTDEAVSKIYQLMRVPNTINTKINPALETRTKMCEVLDTSENTYTCEDLDAALPPITHADEEYCKEHYNKTYDLNQSQVAINDQLPVKFFHLVRSNQEVKEIWAGGVDDRSKGDYRIGHIMFGNGFSKEEALSVLVNSAKALERAPKHRVSYAVNIVDKIWTYELTGAISSTVKEILARKGDTLKGTRFPCWNYIDATVHGFRLGQVIGLVAGSGVGKTAMALNMFMGFVQSNPDYNHFFIPLEQPADEIADRWKTMCGTNTALHDKVHVISNYAEDGSFRHLSLTEIKDYLVKFQETTKKKIGCVVIDHVGALKKKSKDGENQGLMDICHEMKAFAVQTNTMLVMQSQAPREKAGIGDLELNKDAAYGTVYFESYCDYLITIWQPLKRCYADEGCPTVTAFKFCKIRHKMANADNLKEDVSYRLYFDSNTGHLRELTQPEEMSFDFFNVKATNMRKADRKTDIIPYQSIKWTKDDQDNNHKNAS